jgi:hypothetical protein
MSNRFNKGYFSPKAKLYFSRPWTSALPFPNAGGELSAEHSFPY